MKACNWNQLLAALFLTAACSYNSSTIADSPTESENRFDYVFTFSLMTDDFNAVNRRKLVGQIERYCRYALSIIPTNTPTEKAWVQAEIKAVIANSDNTDRGMRLVSTPEYGRHMARLFFSDCWELSEYFMDWYMTHPDSEDFTEVQRSTEAGLMALLAFRLNDVQSMINNVSKVEMDQDSLFISRLSDLRHVRAAILKSAVQSTVIRVSW